MAQTSNKSIVRGTEEILNTYTKEEKRFLLFPVKYWQLINTEHIGNDIHIETDKNIRNVYLNGKLIK
jgi:hypothetical protein